MASCCNRRNIVVIIVFIALLLDNLLLTSVVPILPNYFRVRDEGSLSSDFAAHMANQTHHHDRHMIATTSSPRIPEQHLRHFEYIGHGNTSEEETSHHTSAGHNSTNSATENTRMGIFVGVKTFVQLICNFAVGPITNRMGYTIPMFSGFVILFMSTILFALANTFVLLFVARAIQGIGTALSTTSGMGLLATLFPDQRERGMAQTFAFSGLAAGVLIGPPYGGILYDWTGGKEIPCLILAGVTLLEGVLQLIFMRPQYRPEERKGSSALKLLGDPYILITALSITMSALSVAVLEPVLPIWMYHSMGAPAWLQGVAFVPSTLSYMLCLQVIGAMTHRSKSFDVSHRWKSAFVGIILLGSSITAVPFCPNIYFLIAPLFVNGLGLALVTSSMLPHVGYLVDQRHEPVYGTAYALTDNAFCVAFAVGPALSGPVVDSIGFTWTLVSLGALSVVTAPMLCVLSSPAATSRRDSTPPGEQSPLIPKSVSFSSDIKGTTDEEENNND